MELYEEGKIDEDDLGFELEWGDGDAMIKLLDKIVGRDGAVAGDPIEAYLEGVRMERERVVSKVKRGADIVITTNSGAPLDLNLYQTVKGIYYASLVAQGRRYNFGGIRMWRGNRFRIVPVPP